MTDNEPDRSELEIEITQETIEAGVDVLKKSGLCEIPLDSDCLIVAEIYLAMMEFSDRPAVQTETLR